MNNYYWKKWSREFRQQVKVFENKNPKPYEWKYTIMSNRFIVDICNEKEELEKALLREWHGHLDCKLKDYHPKGRRICLRMFGF